MHVETWYSRSHVHPPLPFSSQCYLFHMYVGVRAGGGIGDEIEDPAGDEYELYRVVFDITFFFFVIVILLAIIQGKYSVGTEMKRFICITIIIIIMLLLIYFRSDY